MSISDFIKDGLWRARHGREGQTIDRPVFVVSCGRSGSTAMRKSLDAHPQIVMGAEAPFVHRYAGLAADYAYAENASYFQGAIRVSEQELRDALRYQLYRSVFGPNMGFAYSWRARGAENHVASGQVRYWGAKAFPDGHEYRGLRWLYAEPRFVYIYRNGIDVVHSMSKKYNFKRFSFRERCERWAERVETYDYLRRAEGAVAVRFEEFVEDNEAVFDEVLRALDLPPSAAPARFASSNVMHPLGAPDEQGSAKEVLERRPPAYASWTDEERAVFVEVCGEGMRTFDYPIPFQPNA
jgi:hypothetical protein